MPNKAAGSSQPAVCRTAFGCAKEGVSLSHWRNFKSFLERLRSKPVAQEVDPRPIRADLSSVRPRFASCKFWNLADQVLPPTFPANGALR